MDAIMSIQQVQDDTPPSPTVPQANNTGTQDPVIQLTKLVQTLQEKVDKMTQPQAPPKNINPKTGKPWKRYCHTHGCCDHWGCNCNDNGPNHKDEATFHNCMGSSNFMCLPVTN